uniref:Translation initiation factor IF-3 n=1 Tax=Gronococcus sybilensis TaxID=3028029 RepID=A0A9Y1MXI4_9RHOD|nr:translation initiation factor 3 [Gronococcus sybilensis]
MKNTKNYKFSSSINENIKFPYIRVINPEGTQLGILDRQEALKVAFDRNLDLVLINEKSTPPVCRIIDYGKYKFTQEKKAKEAKKKQHSFTTKEVKMRYKIEEHDYEVRRSQALKFTRAGHKVKVIITFKGREIQHIDLAEELLKRLASDLNDVAEIQQKPSREGRNLIMLLSPKKQH